MSFAITGLARSGTKWLSKQLDLSPSHEVHHEYPEDRAMMRHADYCALVEKRFRHHGNGYGEVSTYLLYAMGHSAIPVDYRAIVYRNPVNVILSLCNKVPARHNELKTLIQRVDYELHILDMIAKKFPSQADIVYFEDLIDPGKKAVEALAERMGIIDMTAPNYQPINQTRIRRFTSIEPEQLEPLEWFMVRHYGGIGKRA
jgi:hypothetical protein